MLTRDWVEAAVRPVDLGLLFTIEIGPIGKRRRVEHLVSQQALAAFPEIYGITLDMLVRELDR